VDDGPGSLLAMTKAAQRTPICGNSLKTAASLDNFAAALSGEKDKQSVHNLLASQKGHVKQLLQQPTSLSDDSSWRLCDKTLQGNVDYHSQSATDLLM
jgi:hypothetical protein